MSKNELPPQEMHSLGEIHNSVPLPRHPGFWKRLLAFSGPAYLVSVGYMDPGNWATDIAAGSRLNTALLWVLVMSNIMAIILQTLSARLGIVTGMDLAQACRAMFGRRIAFLLWILAELAIAATDLAEVIGSAIGLNLLFGIPLSFGVLLTAFDTFLLLLLHGLGMRVMEAFILVLILTIATCLGVELVLSRPSLESIAQGLVPSLPSPDALYLAIGILGATVMPHNLYLHSALVQSRKIIHTPAGIRAGLRFNLIDSLVALNGALFVNAALLLMAAATFFRSGYHNVAEIQEAHRLLEPILGAKLAPVAFAVALIASGQSSTITGTLAGQIVMEGFLQFRLRPLVRRLITRALALIPALFAIFIFGEHATTELLVFSQVILSLQLSFAVIPLIHLVSDKRWMGPYAIQRFWQLAGWVIASIIAGLNLKLVFESLGHWVTDAGSGAWVIWLLAFPAVLSLIMLLGHIIIQPIYHRLRGSPIPAQISVHGPNIVPAIRPASLPRKLAAAIDFSTADTAVLSHVVALAQERGRSANVLLMHVAESGGAKVMGKDMQDVEAREDLERLEIYCSELNNMDIEASCALGFGDPADQLAQLIAEYKPDLVILGGHGHQFAGDFLHGTTVERLRHKISVPIMVVPAINKASETTQ